jgi:uncharacterized protein YjeT (DUF2065 family)
MTDGQIFQLFGLIYLLIGLGLLFEPQYYRKLIKEMVNHKLIMFLSSYLALGVGFLIITFHNVWKLEWGLIITLMGWMAIIKGTMILVFPKFFNKIALQWIKKGLGLWTPVIIILGIFFFVLGFSL